MQRPADADKKDTLYYLDRICKSTAKYSTLNMYVRRDDVYKVDDEDFIKVLRRYMENGMSMRVVFGGLDKGDIREISSKFESMGVEVGYKESEMSPESYIINDVDLVTF